MSRMLPLPLEMRKTDTALGTYANPHGYILHMAGLIWGDLAPAPGLRPENADLLNQTLVGVDIPSILTLVQ